VNTRPFEVVAAAEEAFRARQPDRAEALYRDEAYTRQEPERLDFALGRYGAFLLDQGRIPEAEAVLFRAIDRRTDIPAIWSERVHKDIASVLARTLKGWLPRITGGRYHDVIVDPTILNVRVAGASRLWREASLLSHGTSEQVYLLLRMAMVEHLTKEDEVCPLIPDDALGEGWSIDPEGLRTAGRRRPRRRPLGRPRSHLDRRTTQSRASRMRLEWSGQGQGNADPSPSVRPSFWL
jgi:hypothetical protein